MTTKYPINSDDCANCNTVGQHTTSACRTPQNVPIPAGAVKVDDWTEPPLDGSDGGLRSFTGIDRLVERGNSRDNIEVLVSGTQYRDGRVKRQIVVDRDYDNALTIAQARQLARHLIAAADEIEQMARYDTPTD